MMKEQIEALCGRMESFEREGKSTGADLRTALRLIADEVDALNGALTPPVDAQPVDCDDDPATDDC